MSDALWPPPESSTGHVVYEPAFMVAVATLATDRLRFFLRNAAMPYHHISCRVRNVLRPHRSLSIAWPATRT
jgi:hypothetical protein